MFEVCDVLCPNMVHWIDQGRPFAEFYLGQQKAGRQLWFYSCSNPGKRLDPYAYHRMQHWFCIEHDARAYGKTAAAGYDKRFGRAAYIQAGAVQGQ